MLFASRGVLSSLFTRLSRTLNFELRQEIYCRSIRYFLYICCTMLRVDVVLLGKTTLPYIEEGLKDYASRLVHYCKFELRVLPPVRNAASLSTEELVKREGIQFMEVLKGYDRVVLLDEHGKEYTSRAFATLVNNFTLQGASRIAFVIGGAYGFSDEVRKAFPNQLSLSQLTFSHQIVRLIFLEQLYRIFTILRGEPYHHD